MFSTNVKALTFVCFSRCRFFLRPLLPSGFHFVKMLEPMLCLFLSNAGFFSEAFNIDIIIKNILSFFCSLVKGLFQNNRGGGGPFEQLFHHVAGKKPMLLLVSGSAQDTLQNTAHILHSRVLYHQEWEGGNT